MKAINKVLEYTLIFWAAQIIFAWILSIFEVYNVKFVLIFTIVLCALFLFTTFKKSARLKIYLASALVKFRNLNRVEKVLFSITLGVWIIFFFYTVIFVFLSPAVNWDSLTYHLTKAAIANQTGSWWYHPDVSVARVNIFGSNASILDGVAFSILGRDYLVELPQVISATLIIPLSLFYIGVKVLKKRKVHSFIATIAILSIPLYLYESKTTQNDLVFTSALLLSIIFTINFLKSLKLRNFIIALIAIGILCGVKYHGIIAGGILGLFILYTLIRSKNKINRKYILSAIFLAPILVLLALPSNIIGALFYQSFFALDTADASKAKSGLETFWANIKHFGEWFYLRPIGDANYYSFDVGHAGIFNMLAVPIFVLIAFQIPIKRNLNKLIFILATLGTVTVLFFLRLPDNWDLRLILFLVVSAVYTSFLYLISMKVKLLSIISLFLVLVVVILNFILTFKNIDREIIKTSSDSILTKGKVMTVGDYYKPRFIESISAFESNDNTNAKVLVIADNYASIYPYYGDDWSNTVNYFEIKDISNEKLKNIKWDFLVINHYSYPYLLEEIENLNLNYNILTTDYYVNIYTNDEVN